MNIDPDQIYHAVEPIDVKREDRRPLEKMCEVCGKPFTPHKLAPWAKYCKDPECVKHRNVIRQMEFYRRRPEYTGKRGRPRKTPTGPKDDKRAYDKRSNGVEPENRSEQLKYYYKKKAGKVDSLEGKLKNI